MQSVIDSVSSVTVNDEVVTDREHIKDFISHCDREIFNTIKEFIDRLNKKNSFLSVDVDATEEMKKFGITGTVTANIDLNPMAFFSENNNGAQ